jgi:hypothetical protein
MNADDSLLAVLRVALSDGDRRAVVIEALSRAALHHGIGAYVRDRLYAWLRSAQDPKVIDAITEICGGQFGTQEPDLALTRLRLAAQKTGPDSQLLADAIGGLAVRHPRRGHAAVQAGRSHHRRSGFRGYARWLLPAGPR